MACQSVGLGRPQGLVLQTILVLLVNNHLTAGLESALFVFPLELCKIFILLSDAIQRELNQSFLVVGPNGQ